MKQKTPLIITIINHSAGTLPVKLFDTKNINESNFGNDSAIQIDLGKLNVTYEQLMRELLLENISVNRIRVESSNPISSFIFRAERVDSEGNYSSAPYVLTNKVVANFIDEIIPEDEIIIGNESQDKICFSMKPQSTIDLFIYPN